MKLHQGLHILLFFCLAFCGVSKAFAADDVLEGPDDVQDEVKTDTPQKIDDDKMIEQNNADPSKNLVELHYHKSTLKPYVERRDTSGFEYSFGYEYMDVSAYQVPQDSSDDLGASYTKGLSLGFLDLSYKRNIELGSFTIGFNGGGGGSSLMKVERYGVMVKFIADAIGGEPYLAPYVGLGYQLMSFQEKDSAQDYSANINSSGMVYTLGAMIQLNWIDQASAEYATFHFGLQNTFLNIYVSDYTRMATNNGSDPTSTMIFGSGMVLEF